MNSTRSSGRRKACWQVLLHVRWHGLVCHEFNVVALDSDALPAHTWQRPANEPRLTGTMTSLRFTLALVCSSVLPAEQHITLQVPLAVYTATVDDSLERDMKLQLLPVLSPITDTGPPLNPYLTAIGNPGDKVMLSPNLEDCQHGSPNCPPTLVNDAFLQNARANIERGRNQIRDFQRERLPKSLEPVRRFLLNNLTTTARMEEARYEYIKTGALPPLTAMLMQYCAAGEEGLITNLQRAPDAEARRERSQYDWHNEVWRCYRERSPKYPTEAWKRFVQQYKVQESAMLLE